MAFPWPKISTDTKKIMTYLLPNNTNVYLTNKYFVAMYNEVWIEMKGYGEYKQDI